MCCAYHWLNSSYFKRDKTWGLITYTLWIIQSINMNLLTKTIRHWALTSRKNYHEPHAMRKPVWVNCLVGWTVRDIDICVVFDKRCFFFWGGGGALRSGQPFFSHFGIKLILRSSTLQYLLSTWLDDVSCSRTWSETRVTTRFSRTKTRKYIWAAIVRKPDSLHMRKQRRRSTSQ